MASPSTGNDQTSSANSTELEDCLNSKAEQTELELGFGKIGIQNAKDISRFIISSTCLQSLNLERNKIEKESIKVICEAIKSSVSLQKLCLKRNFINDRSAGYIGSMLKSHRLRVLQLGGIILNLPNIHCVINVQLGNKLGNKGAAKILSALKHNTSLTSLSLDDNDISILPEVDPKCYDSLLNLDVSFNQLYEVPISFVVVLDNNRKLQIDFRENSNLQLPEAALDNSEKLIKHMNRNTELGIIKVVVMGHANAGKTTLINALTKQGKFTAKKVNKKTQSTISLDVAAHSLGSTLDFRFFDFAGQIEYVSSHKLFFNSNDSSLILLLVVDCSTPLQQQEQHISYWGSFICSNFRRLLAGRASNDTSINLVVVGTKVKQSITNKDYLLPLTSKIMDNIIQLNQVPLNSSSGAISVQYHFVDAFSGQGLAKLHKTILALGSQLAKQQNTMPLQLKCGALKLARANAATMAIDNFITLSKLQRKYKGITFNQEVIDFCCKVGLITANSMEGITTDAKQIPDSVLTTAPGENAVQHENTAIISDKEQDDNAIILCLYPPILAKVVGSLLCADDHLLQLKDESQIKCNQELKQSDILSSYQVKLRLQLIFDTKDDEKLQQIISFLPSLEVAYKLTELEKKFYIGDVDHSEQDYYLIPSLRPVVDAQLMTYVLHSLTTRYVTPTVCAVNLESNMAVVLSRHDFNRLQLELREKSLQDLNYKIFVNSMVLHSSDLNAHGLVIWRNEAACITVYAISNSNTALLLIQNVVKSLNAILCDKQSTDYGLDLTPAAATICQGKKQIELKLDIQDTFLSVQPICALHSYYLHENTLLQHKEDSGIFCLGSVPCAYSKEEILYGTNILEKKEVTYQIKKSLDCYSHYPWAPTHKAAFYDKVDELCKWSTFEDNHNNQSLEHTYSKSNLRYVEIDENTESNELHAEFLKVRELFFKFVGRDKEKNFILTKVVFLQNPELEQQFATTFQKFVVRSATSNMNSVDDKIHKSDDNDAKEWRKRILANLEDSVDRISGNAAVNLLMAWHGTSEDVCFKIANSNFRVPEALDADELQLLQSGVQGMNSLISKYREQYPKINDLGYFGRGIYFSERPNYGEEFANKSYFSKAKKEENSNIDNGGLEEHPMLLCYLLLGRVCPIIEHPVASFPNYHGSSCAAGFDSHYTVVNSKGYPCQLLKHEIAKADEIVLFSQAQILPRYIVYFKRFNATSAVTLPTTGNNCSSPNLKEVDLDNKKNVVLWVDPNVSSVKAIAATVTSTTIIHSVVSNNEAQVWAANNEQIILDLLKAKRFKIVCNKYRKADGGETAAHRLIKMIQQLHFLPSVKRIPLMIFCSTLLFRSGVDCVDVV